jgi:hypothetical protein
MILTVDKNKLKDIRFDMGVEENPPALAAIKTSIKNFLNPSPVKISVPKPLPSITTFIAKYGKIDWSFKNDQSAEQIDVNDLNKNGLDVVGTNDKVNIPEGTEIKETRITNDKKKLITLIELTLPKARRLLYN